MRQRGLAREPGHLSSSAGVVFKGFRHGLRLLLPPEGDFRAIRADLSKKLKASGEFFRGAKVYLDQSRRRLTLEQSASLRSLLDRNGVELVERDPPAPAESAPGTEPTLVVRAPVRSGQRVTTEGSVLILGDVHPGAEILAGGDVIVMGAARGAIAAGLAGGSEARVFAFQLRPSLLRLGGVVAGPAATGPRWRAEVARVRDGQIVVEPFTGWQRPGARRLRKD